MVKSIKIKPYMQKINQRDKSAVIMNKKTHSFFLHFFRKILARRDKIQEIVEE